MTGVLLERQVAVSDTEGCSRKRHTCRLLPTDSHNVTFLASELTPKHHSFPKQSLATARTRSANNNDWNSVAVVAAAVPADYGQLQTGHLLLRHPWATADTGCVILHWRVTDVTDGTWQSCHCRVVLRHSCQSAKPQSKKSKSTHVSMAWIGVNGPQN